MKMSIHAEHAAPNAAAAAALKGKILPEAKPLFAYRKHWAHRFGTAPFFPMTRAEMDTLGWDSCDIILITGGLGPTKDDITKKTLCEYFDCGFKTDADVLNDIT